MTSDPTPEPPALRVSFVPGVTPDKWARRWAEQEPRVRLDLTPVEEEQQRAVLFDGRADMCFVRLPVDREGLHVIPLYEEVPVVVAPKGHLVEAADEVSVADLADEHLVGDPDLVPAWRDVATEIRDGTRTEVPTLSMRQAVETVAAGVGIVIVPMSVARLHHRKDVVHRPVVDLPTTTVGLAWRRDLEDERTEAFVGVVRGRTANSSRGPASPTSAERDRTPKDRPAQNRSAQDPSGRGKPPRARSAGKSTARGSERRGATRGRRRRR